MKKNDWILSPSPFIVNSQTVTTMSIIIACTLIPHLVMLAVDRDLTSLLQIAVALTGSLLAELCIIIPQRRNTLGDGLVLVQGLLTGLLLPVGIPLISIALISFLSVLICRVLFGGTGYSWLHPSVAAVAIAYVSAPHWFPDNLAGGETIGSIGSILGAFKLENFRIGQQDMEITAALNRMLSSIAGIKLPEGYVSLFWNAPSSIPAFRYNIFTLAGSLVLISMKTVDWYIPAVFIGVYAALVRIFAMYPLNGLFMQGDMLFSILTSGILFIAFYVLTDTSSSPRTITGKLVYGMSAGIFAWLLCGPGGSHTGIFFAVLLTNISGTAIEQVETRIHDFHGARA